MGEANLACLQPPDKSTAQPIERTEQAVVGKYCCPVNTLLASRDGHCVNAIGSRLCGQRRNHRFQRAGHDACIAVNKQARGCHLIEQRIDEIIPGPRFTAEGQVVDVEVE